MKNTYKILTLLALITLFVSCNKEENSINTQTNTLSDESPDFSESATDGGGNESLELGNDNNF